MILPVVPVPPVLAEWVALQVRRPRTRGFVMYGQGESPAFALAFALALGITSILLLIWALHNRSVQKSQAKSREESPEDRTQGLTDRLSVLPNEVQEQIVNRTERYAAVMLPLRMGPRKRNDAVQQFLALQVNRAESVWREASLLIERRLQLLDARIDALPEEVRCSVRKQMEEFARPVTWGGRLSWDGGILLEQFGALLATLAEIRIHVPRSRSSVLSARLNALPSDAMKRVTVSMTRFAYETLRSTSSPEERSAAWERRFTELLTVAEAGYAPVRQGKVPP